MSLNKVQLIGNLTRDPEMRQIPGGQVVTTFGMATNLVWTDQSGERQSKAEFHNIVAWRKLGEICGQYLKKGGKVYIEGRLQTRDWEGEDGVKRYRTEIVADNMIMLDKKGDNPGGGMDTSMEREAGGIEDSSSDDSFSEDAKEPASKKTAGKNTKNSEEEDVKIDDLPF
ncbi:single-stranded DNA-binding protein [Candidatus Peregrinibacteria bacterium]|nr:single-stranded DNA-binding protein [Candidatus Peregrinibacteria bacterium]